MAYARKKAAGSSYNRSGSGSSGRGTVKRSAGGYRKTAASKSGVRRVAADKPQTIRIEIVQASAHNGVSRPDVLGSANVKLPRRAQF
jgi:hypothetical protein